MESTISMSLAKRFTIRPMGVVSKKEIGARKMAATRAEYSLVEAETDAQARANDCTETKKTETTVDTLKGCSSNDVAVLTNFFKLGTPIPTNVALNTYRGATSQRQSINFYC